MKKKANIYEIFRKFDEDGSDSIDRNELKVLLDELQVPMNPDEIAELVTRLDGDGGGEIEFEVTQTCHNLTQNCHNLTRNCNPRSSTTGSWRRRTRRSGRTGWLR